MPRVPRIGTRVFRGPLTQIEAGELDARLRALQAEPPMLMALLSQPATDLRAEAARRHIDTTADPTRNGVITALLEGAAGDRGVAVAWGILEIEDEGHGFLRAPSNNLSPGVDDVYIAPSQICRLHLRAGQGIHGFVRPPKPGETHFSLLKVEAVDGRPPADATTRASFEDLVAVHPFRRLKLETSGEPLGPRVIDLLTPIGMGQRGLIVAPPRTGKTTLLTEIAEAIEQNHPEAALIVLLIDERPEEVTTMRARVTGTVVASTFDEPPEHHARLASLVLHQARHQAAAGHDVVILLDSITRLARACNAAAPHSGRLLSGGVESSAMQWPKRFFGAARATEHGGSLTVIATALTDTGSRLDDVIFEEFAGTGNLEIVLSRDLADRRVFPAIDVHRSGTRHDELLVDAEDAIRVKILRRVLYDMHPAEAARACLAQLARTRSNADLLKTLAR